MTDAGDSLELVRAALRGAAPARPAFVPFVHAVAARLLQVPLPELTRTPTALANVLARAQRLFGYDAVVVGYDDTIGAEACGCLIDWDAGRPEVRSHPWRRGAVPDPAEACERGRVSVVVEAAARLRSDLDHAAAVIGVVPGPWTLASSLYGPDLAGAQAAGENRDEADCLRAAGRVAVAIARRLGEVRVDALLVLETAPRSRTPALLEPVTAAYRSIGKVARFYDSAAVLTLSGDDPAYLAAAPGISALAPGRPLTAEEIAAVSMTVALPLSHSAFTSAEGPVPAIRAALAASPTWITTASELRESTPPEHLHAAVAAIRAGRQP